MLFTEDGSVFLGVFFGLIALSMVGNGCMLAFMSIRGRDFQGKALSVHSMLTFGGLAVVLLALGSLFYYALAYRTRIELNRTTRSIATLKHRLVPFVVTRNEKRMDDVDHVSIIYFVDGGSQNRRAPSWYVTLVMRDQSKFTFVRRPRVPGATKAPKEVVREAQEVADFIGIPFRA